MLKSPLIIIVPAFVTCIILFVTSWYKDAKSGCCGKIKFRQFQSFYAINPKRWSLGSNFVSYCGDNLYFSMLDTIRYQLWKKKIDEEELKRYNNRHFTRVLARLQNDIDEYRKENGK